MNMFYARRPFSYSSSSSCSSKNHSLQTLLKRGFTPTLKSINIFLLSLLRHHKFNLIIHLFTTATLIPTNPITHSIFTWALLHPRSFQDADNLMLTHFTHSYPHIWDTLICTHHDLHKALFLLRFCLQNGTILPSHLTFSSLIHRLSSQGDLGMAMEASEIMTDHRVWYLYGDFVCSSVISGFYRIERPELVLGFYDNAVGSMVLLRLWLVTLTAIVGALVKVPMRREPMNKRRESRRRWQKGTVLEGIAYKKECPMRVMVGTDECVPNARMGMGEDGVSGRVSKDERGSGKKVDDEVELAVPEEGEEEYADRF
ncbi:hypothetical protein AHAS_Ahas14G0105000 [Arachis hypogaea]